MPPARIISRCLLHTLFASQSDYPIHDPFVGVGGAGGYGNGEYAPGPGGAGEYQKFKGS